MTDEAKLPDDKNQPPPQHIVADYLENQQLLQLHQIESKLKKARNTIFVIAGLVLAGDLITMATTNSFTTITLLISFGVAAIFVGLGFLTKKQPLMAIISALILFLAIWGAAIAFASTQYIYKGILVRAIIIYFLITGIKYAREAEQLRKEIGR